MTIGIDASRANHEEKTGVEWYAWHLIEEFKKTIPDTHRVILYSDRPLQGTLSVLPAHWESRVLRWPPRRLWTQVRLSYEMLVRRPDVLFIPAHVCPIIHPERTVMTVHDIAAVRFPETYDWFERWYSLRSARFAVRHLAAVIVPSEFVKKELLQLVQHDVSLAHNIAVVPHGFDEQYAAVPDQEQAQMLLEQYHIATPYVLSVGRLEEKKNTAGIIEAFGRVRSRVRAELILVGQPGHGYEKVKEAIVRSPYKHDIRLLGWLPPEDVSVLMHQARAFVFPSFSEGFGIPVLEALAAGTPVIAGTGSSLEEVGGGAVTYVDPGNTDDIGDAMRDALDERWHTQDEKMKRIDRAKQFSWVKSARETLQVLLKHGK